MRKKIKHYIAIGFFSFLAIFFLLFIIISNLNSAAKNKKAFNRCTNEKSSSVDFILCLENYIKKISKKGGPDKGFQAIMSIYKNNRSVQKHCHELTHSVGISSYFLFKAGKLNMSSYDQTSMCAFGFYHGFIETLMAKGESIEKAKKFCDLTKNTTRDKSKPINSCYHGIGHGLSDTHAFKNQADLIKKTATSLDLCDKITNTDELFTNCAAGVYNSAALLLIKQRTNQGVLDYTKNPYKFCDNFIQGKTPCYQYMSLILFSPKNRDFSKTLQYVVENHSDDTAKIGVRWSSYYAGRYYVNRSDFSVFQKVCQSLNQSYKDICIFGFINGMSNWSILGQEHIKPILFCSNDIFSDHERSYCFTQVLRILETKNSITKTESVRRCKDATSPLYKKYCEQ